MCEISTKFFLNSELIFLTAIYPLSCVLWCWTTIIFSSLLVFSPPFLPPGSWYTFIIFLSLSSQSLCLPTQYLKKYLPNNKKGCSQFSDLYFLCARETKIFRQKSLSPNSKFLGKDPNWLEMINSFCRWGFSFYSLSPSMIWICFVTYVSLPSFSFKPFSIAKFCIHMLHWKFSTQILLTVPNTIGGAQPYWCITNLFPNLIWHTSGITLFHWVSRVHE